MKELEMDAFYASAVRTKDAEFEALHAAAVAVVDAAGDSESPSRAGFVDWGSWPPRGG